jgi:hypothetical protein
MVGRHAPTGRKPLIGGIIFGHDVLHNIDYHCYYLFLSRRLFEYLKGKLGANSYMTGNSVVWRNRHSTCLDLEEGTIKDATNLRYARDRTQEKIKPVTSDVDCLHVDNTLLTTPKRTRAGTVKQTKLLISPNGINHVGFSGNADGSASTKSLPIASTINIQFGKDLINSPNEVGLLFEGVTRCNSNAEAFLAAGDGWIINGLNVNVVLRK